MDRLDPARIRLPGTDVRVVERCGSTNSALLKDSSRSMVVLAAEAQTAGRGRRGRRWHSTPGSDLTFSIAVSLRRPARELAALSLAAGVAVTRALRAAGVRGAALKWPNDIVVGGAKLGGILVETRADNGGTRAVFGVGINCRRSPALSARLRRPVAALEEFIRPDRNRLLHDIAAELIDLLPQFEARGFDALRAEWEALDAYAGQRILVRFADGRTLSGIASGVGDDGALRLRNRGGMHSVSTGRVVQARPA